MRCSRCPGTLLFDRIDREYRCLLCGRAVPAVRSGATAPLIAREPYGPRTRRDSAPRPAA